MRDSCNNGFQSFTQSGPKFLDLPPPRACILRAIRYWGVGKVKFTRLPTIMLHREHQYCLNHLLGS